MAKKKMLPIANERMQKQRGESAARKTGRNSGEIESYERSVAAQIMSSAVQKHRAMQAPTKYVPRSTGKVTESAMDAYHAANPATKRTMEGLSMTGWELTNEQLNAILSGEAAKPNISGWEYFTNDAMAREAVERSVADSAMYLQAASDAGRFDTEGFLVPGALNMPTTEYIRKMQQQYQQLLQNRDKAWNTEENLRWINEIGTEGNNQTLSRIGMISNYAAADPDYYAGVDGTYNAMLDMAAEYGYNDDYVNEVMTDMLRLNHIINGGDLAGFDSTSALEQFQSLPDEQFYPAFNYLMDTFGTTNWANPYAITGLHSTEQARLPYMEKELETREAFDEIVGAVKDQIISQGYTLTSTELDAVTEEVNEKYAYFGDNTGYGNLMTPEEKFIYAYLKWQDATGSEADAYFQLLQQEKLYSRRGQANAAETQLYATDPLFAVPTWLGTVGAGLVDVPRGIEKLYHAFRGDDNPNAPWHDQANYRSTARLAQGEAIEEGLGGGTVGSAARFAYDAASGTADFGAAYLTGKGLGALAGASAGGTTQALMSLQAASADLTATAGDDTEGIWRAAHAVGVAGIEYLTEEYSIEALLSDPTNAMQYIRRNMLAEGSEEFASSALNHALDFVTAGMNGAQPELIEMYNQYAAAGEENAFSMALGQTLGDMIYEGMIGAATGGMIAVPGATVNWAQNVSAGRNVTQAGGSESLIKLGEEMGSDTESGKLAKTLANTAASGKKVSNAKLGRLYRTLLQETAVDYQDTLREVAVQSVEEAIDQRYEQTGVEKETDFTSREMAEAIVDAQGSKNGPTGEIGKYIRKSRVPLAIMREFGGSDAAWTQGYQVRQLKEQLKYAGKVGAITATARKAEEAGGGESSASPDAIEKETQERVETLTRRKKPSEKMSPTIAFVEDEGRAEVLGSFVRAEGTGSNISIVVEHDGEKKSIPLPQIRQVSAGGIARVIAYAESRPEIQAEEINAMVSVLQETDGKATVKASEVIAAYETGVKAGFVGAERPALSEVVETVIHGKKAAEALETVLEMGYKQGSRESNQAETRRRESAKGRAKGIAAVAYMGEVENAKDVKDTGVRESVETIMNDLTPQQNAAVRALGTLSEASGIGFTLFRTKAAHGEELQTPNGFYDPETNSIFIDLQAGQSKGGETMVESAILKTASHELTHYIEMNTQDGYAKLRDAARQLLGKRGQNYGTLIEKKLRTESHITTRMQAEAEVIADACEMMLKDSTAVQTLAKNNQSLWEKMKTWLKDFARRVKRAFSGLIATSEEAQALTEIRDGVERYVGNLQQLWDNALVEAAGKETAAEVTEKKGDVVEEREYQARSAKYDYSKSFADQVDDWANKKFPANDALIVGRTPELYRKIGLGDLPLTINQTHVDYIVNGTKDADHHMGVAWLKQLPAMMANPVAVIRSDTDPENSVVVILSTKINGKQIIAPVYVNGNSINNGMRIDSNNVATAFGKSNALTKLLTDALTTESKQGKEVGVYYWNKTEARSLYEGAGLQLPGSSIQDGLIHSIFDAGSDVNRKMVTSQTESQQFRRWFGNSEVIDENGEALVVYHTTRDSFYKFDKERLGSITATNATDNFLAATAHTGFWFNTAPLTTKGMGENAMAVFLKAERLYEVGTLDALVNEIWDTYNQLGYDYDSEDPTIEQAREAGEVFRGWLEQRGYDGIAVEDTEFGGVSYVVFEPEQIKSATDNVGTFDPANPDIRYSQRRGKPDLSVRDALMAITDFTGMTPAESSLLTRYQGNVLKLEEVTEAIAEKTAIRDNKETPEKERGKAKQELWRLKRQKYAIERALIDAENEGGYAKLMTTAGEMVRLLTTKDTLPEVTQALQEQMAKVTEQLAQVQAELGEMAEEDMWNTIRSLFDQTKLRAAAKKLKALYGSRISEKTLMNRIVLMQTTLLRGGENASAEYLQLGEELVRELRSKAQQDSEMLSILKEHIGTITITEAQRQEINNTIGMKEFLQVVKPVVNVVSKGKASVTLDVLLNEANAAEGSTNPLLPYFEGHMGEGDSIMHLYNLIKGVKTANPYAGRYGQEQLQAEMIDALSIAAEATLVDAGAETVKKVMDALTKNAEGSDALTAKVRQLRLEMAKAGRAANAAAWKVDERHKAMDDVIQYLTALEEQNMLLEKKDAQRTIERQVADKTNDRVKTLIAERVMMERNRVMRERIRRTVGWMVTRIRRETDRKNVPEELKPYIEDMIRIFAEYNDVLRVFRKSEIADIQRIFGKLKKYDTKREGALNDLIKEDLDEDFKELRERLEKEDYDLAETMDQEMRIRLEEYGAVKTKSQRVKTINRNKSLKVMDEIVEILWGQITKWNETFIGGKTAQLSDVAAETVAGLKARKNYAIADHAGGKLWEAVKDAARNRNLTPIYFFRLLGNKVMQTLNDDIVQAQREYGVMLAESKKTLEKIQAKHHYWTWKNADPLEFTTEQGKRTKNGLHDISLTVDEAMSIWAIWIREQDTTPLFESTHLSEGGFELQSGKRNVNGKLEEDAEPHKLSKADMEVIDNWLTEEQKAYAEAIVEYMSKDMAEIGNRASMRLFGIRKFKEEHYFPMSVQRDQTAQSSNKAAKNPDANRIAGMSSAQRRVERAWKPLAIGSFTEVAANHINDMLLYGTFAVPIENFNTVLNYNYVKNAAGEDLKDEDASSMTIRALFRQKYGSDLTSYLETYLADLNGGTGVRENSKLMSLYKRSAVMASVSVMLQQPLSIIRAWMVQSVKYYLPIINGTAKDPKKSEWEQLCRYSGAAVLKGIGGFDMTSTRTMGGYLAGTAEDTYDLAKKAGALVGVNEKGERLAGVQRQFDALLGLGAQKADQMAWTYMWRATKAEMAEKNPGMDTSSEEFLQMAGKRFDDVVNLTQVYDSTLVRSQNMRSKSVFAKMATAFMGEATLTLNMLLDGWNTGSKKDIVKAAGIFLLIQVATAAVKSLWTAGRKEDEEKPWLEKYLAAVGGELGGYGGSLNPLNLIPYARDAMSLLEGYDVERADMVLVDQLLDEAKKWMSGKYEDKPEEGAKNMAFALSNLLGIPMKNIWRDVTTGINTWKDATEPRRAVNTMVLTHEAVSNFLPWVDVSSEAYYTRLYQAMQAGDTKEVEALREFLGTQGEGETAVNSGVKKVVKKLYKVEVLTEEDAKTFLLKNGLVKDEKTAFQTVDRWRETPDKDDPEYDEYSYSVYNTMREAIDNRNAKATEAAVKEMTDNGYEEDDVRGNLRGYINEEYREGRMTQKEAQKLLEAHGGIDEEDLEDEHYWYWHFAEQDWKRDTGESTGWSRALRMKNAIDSGNQTEIKKALKEMTDHGYTEEEAASAVHSYSGKQYMTGKITYEAAKKISIQHGGKSDWDENDWYWEKKRWDYGKANKGKLEGYSKYGNFYSAVETGKDLRAVVKEYTSHGVEAKTLAGNLTTKYKDEFVRLYKTNKTAAANLQARLLNAYAVLGYDRAKKQKDIAKWLEE